MFVLWLSDLGFGVGRRVAWPGLCLLACVPFFINSVQKTQQLKKKGGGERLGNAAAHAARPPPGDFAFPISQRVFDALSRSIHRSTSAIRSSPLSLFVDRSIDWWVRPSTRRSDSKPHAAAPALARELGNAFARPLRRRPLQDQQEEDDMMMTTTSFFSLHADLGTIRSVLDAWSPTQTHHTCSSMPWFAQSHRLARKGGGSCMRGGGSTSFSSFPLPPQWKSKNNNKKAASIQQHQQHFYARSVSGCHLCCCVRCCVGGLTGQADQSFNRSIDPSDAPITPTTPPQALWHVSRGLLRTLRRNGHHHDHASATTIRQRIPAAAAGPAAGAAAGVHGAHPAVHHARHHPVPGAAALRRAPALGHWPVLHLARRGA